MSAPEQQLVTITLSDGEKHYLTGVPSIIYGKLITQMEVEATRYDGRQGSVRYALRLAPGTPFAMTYDAPETEEVPR